MIVSELYVPDVKRFLFIWLQNGFEFCSGLCMFTFFILNKAYVIW
jgi:hypothetical protein